MGGEKKKSGREIFRLKKKIREKRELGGM